MNGDPDHSQSGAGDRDTADRSDAAAGATEAPEPTPDLIEGVVTDVRRDLAERRARGDLPALPTDELDRQFSAVVEAVEAGIVEQPPLDPGDLTGPAVLESWRPSAERPGMAMRLVDLLVSPLTRVVGFLVRRQVGNFSRRTAAVIEELAERQNRILFFLSRTHLDRQRRLEYRVAELEREVEQLRAAHADADGAGEAAANPSRSGGA